jgi:hypothetical protein
LISQQCCPAATSLTTIGRTAVSTDRRLDRRPPRRRDRHPRAAAHGHFALDQPVGKYEFHREGKPATAFLFKLISQLQFSGTVPMIDVQAYAQWLSK